MVINAPVTTFEVTLPCCRPPTLVPGLSRPAACRGYGRKHLTHTILIVDDSELIRRTLRTYIEQHTDWSVCGEAENGRVAVEKVGQLHPKVVIIDFQMPVMNGLEAARQIKQVAPETFLVMLTMHYSQELLNQAHEAGVHDVLSKSDHIAGRLLASLRNASAES